jgi:DNA-directed RNA polymerase specialized sigma24 family protein
MVKIPYDKENEEKLREWGNNYEFKKGTYKGHPLPIEEWGEELSDDYKWVMDKNEQIDIDIAINELPPQQKRVAELILEGFRLIEIAKIMKLSPPTIRGYFKIIKERIQPFDEK